jgi:hypothetical protein
LSSRSLSERAVSSVESFFSSGVAQAQTFRSNSDRSDGTSEVTPPGIAYGEPKDHAPGPDAMLLGLPRSLQQMDRDGPVTGNKQPNPASDGVLNIGHLTDIVSPHCHVRVHSLQLTECPGPLPASRMDSVHQSRLA